jgi:predicted metal-binding protein
MAAATRYATATYEMDPLTMTHETPDADLPTWIERAGDLGAEARPIDPAAVATAEWVRMKCRYGCPDYDTSFACPPSSPTPSETRRVLDEYAAALLLRVAVATGGDAAEQSRRLSTIALTLERELFIAGCHKALAIIAGGFCKPCETRDCLPAGHCLFPDHARPSIAASGIDVFATSAAAGWPLHVVNDGDDPYRLFALILIR